MAIKQSPTLTVPTGCKFHSQHWQPPQFIFLKNPTISTHQNTHSQSVSLPIVLSYSLVMCCSLSDLPVDSHIDWTSLLYSISFTGASLSPSPLSPFPWHHLIPTLPLPWVSTQIHRSELICLLDALQLGTPIPPSNLGDLFFPRPMHFNDTKLKRAWQNKKKNKNQTSTGNAKKRSMKSSETTAWLSAMKIQLREKTNFIIAQSNIYSLGYEKFQIKQKNNESEWNLKQTFGMN